MGNRENQCQQQINRDVPGSVFFGDKQVFYAEENINVWNNISKCNIDMKHDLRFENLQRLKIKNFCNIGCRLQVSGFRFQVSGFRFQVSGFRFQVGFCYLFSALCSLLTSKSNCISFSCIRKIRPCKYKICCKFKTEII